MESRSGPGAKVAIPRPRRPDQQTVLPKPPRICSVTVDKACNRCRKRNVYNLKKIKYSGTRPRCIDCGTQNLEYPYHEKRRDRLRDASHKNQALSTLLNGISVDLEASRKRTEDTLKDFEDDTPHTPAVPIKSISKRLRRASSFDEQDDNGPNSAEAQAAASVGSIEELDFLEGDQLQNEDASETGYMGRNSQVQWLRSLRAKLRQPEEEGCVSWRQLMTAKEEDFDRLGFKLGHRRKIQRAIATMDGYPQSEPLPFYGVRTVQVNSNLARDMLSFSGHHEDQSVFLMTKESKQPQEYLHFDAHSPKRAITSVLNNLSSSQGATRSKPIRLLIEEGHLAESPESIKNVSPVRCASRRKRKRSD